MKNFIKTFGIMMAALAMVMAACSTETRVLPKKPVITDPLSLQSNQYPQGATAVPLTVTATTKDKKAKLSYQWYSNTTNSNKKGAKIAGATDVDYTPSTEAIGDFYYYVEVVSTLNKEKAKISSDVATITVVSQADIPRVSSSSGEGEAELDDDEWLIVQLPESIEELIENDEVEVFYQWYDNGSRKSNVGGTAIEGATESSYNPPTNVAGIWYYYVVITVKDKKTGEVLKTLTSDPTQVRVVINEVNNDKVRAGQPTLRPEGQPVGGTYYVDLADSEPAVLTVTATSPDRNGFLTYQWYSRPDFGNSEGTLIEYAVNATYYPPMTTASELYYYVEITNTIPDNGDGADKSRTITSSPAKVIIIQGLHVVAPTITTQPINPSGTYNEGAAIPALTVVASVPATQTQAGAKLSYQWYRYNFAQDGITIQNETPVPPFPENNSDPTYGKTAGFIPPNVKSLWYYYVIVTNTLPPAADGAPKVATTKSNVVCVGVGLTAVTMTGVTVAGKNYDGTTTAEWSGVPTITKNSVYDDVYVVSGTVSFPSPNAGTHTIVWSNEWALGGAQREEYLLKLPALTAVISKVAGSTVTKPVESATNPPTSSSITVDPVGLDSKPETLQTIEYLINTSATGTTGTWVSTTTFNNLPAGTNHYVHARAADSTNYNAGAVSHSDVIKTLDPVVTFVVNGGSTITPVSVEKGQKVEMPTDPIRTNYVFDYWYKEATFTTPCDFEAPVNDNMTLYAKWVSRTEIENMGNRLHVPMVWIRGGSFLLGASALEDAYTQERPQHRVVLSGFWMAKTETLQDIYLNLTTANPSNWKDLPSGETGGKLPVHNIAFYRAVRFCNLLSVQDGLTPAYTISWTCPSIPAANQSYLIASYSGTDVSRWPKPTDWRGDDVGRVWTDAVQAAYDAITIVPNATGYRLPTSAQWEYAARGGTTTAYSTGGTVSANTGWYTDTSGVVVGSTTTKRPHAVGLKPVPANAYGLFDMHGNVAEWCWDWYTASPYSTTGTEINPVVDVKGSNTTRTLRGGNYNSTAKDIRSAYRIGGGTGIYLYSGVVGGNGSGHPFMDVELTGTAYGHLGFRVVKP